MPAIGDPRDAGDTCGWREPRQRAQWVPRPRGVSMVTSRILGVSMGFVLRTKYGINGGLIVV